MNSRLVSGSFCGLTAAFFFLFFVFSASAQSLDFGNTSLEMSPQYPEPFQEISISLNSYSVNTSGATISWTIDGEPQVEDKNKRQISIFTGPLGEQINVNAVITLPSGVSFSLKKVVEPSFVDVIIEADTTVPVFYKGRALPTQGSSIRAIAIPHTKKSGPYSYRWKLDSKVLSGGAIQNKNSVDIDLPLFKGSTLAVSVFDKSGELVAEKNVLLRVEEPEIHFYENNPLRGLSRRELPGRHTLVNEETTVRGEVYFVNREDGVYSWRLNGKEISANENDHRSVTLRTSGSSGNASLELSFRNPNALFQYIKKSFSVFF